MKIKLKNTPEQNELVKAMGSKDIVTSQEAQSAFAAFIQPVILKVLDKLAISSMIYEDLPYDEDSSPTIPLDLYYGQGVNYISTWSQTEAGGLPTNIVSGLQELVISTYRLDSAIGMYKKYARRSRLDVVAAALNRLSQELTVKLERNAFAVLLKALAEASTVINGTATVHTITSTTQNVLQIDDFNRLLTLIKRLNMSFDGGTPVAGQTTGLTDILLSPEMMEQIRAFAYQPMSTRTVPSGGSNTAGIALPDSTRLAILNAAGATEFYGKTLHEVNELGVGYKYNVLFDTFSTASIAHSSQAFDATDDEIIIGLDLSQNAFLRPLAKNAESGSTLEVRPDDQWNTRQDKMGFFTSIEEGRVVTQARCLAGIVV